MLQIKSLKKSYLQGEEKISIYDNLNFTLNEVKTASILGKSGIVNQLFSLWYLESQKLIVVKSF